MIQAVLLVIVTLLSVLALTQFVPADTSHAIAFAIGVAQTMAIDWVWVLTARKS